MRYQSHQIFKFSRQLISEALGAQHARTHQYVLRYVVLYLVPDNSKKSVPGVLLTADSEFELRFSKLTVTI